MRRILLGFVLILSVSSVILCHAHAAPLRIGSAGLSGELLPLWIAQNKRIFKKYGFDSEVITFQGGPLAVQALVSGSIQFHLDGHSSIIDAKMQGADTATLAVFIDSLPYTLIAAQKIKSVGQLRSEEHTSELQSRGHIV